MIQITDKEKCCGCTACANICPKKCITMQADEEGFLYPVVESESCIHCNLCEKVCPVVHNANRSSIEKAFIVRNKNEEIVHTSSSGGFFAALCAYVIEKKGVVFGAGFGSDWEVRHCRANSIDECKSFQGSKYVQSNMEGVFPSIKKLLNEGVLVCFSGTPCQTEGLVNFLGEMYDNLILVDLVCHGVPSPKLWRLYLALMTKRYTSKIKDVNFRSKKYGYQSSAMSLKFENGTEYCGSARVDIMLKSFFSHISLRPICYSCPFKGERRVADFTIYDCWHAASILAIKDDDMGYTSVLVRNANALRIITALEKYLDIYEKPIAKILPINGGMLNKSATPNINRKHFYEEIDFVGLQNTFDKYLFVSKKDYAIEKIKAVISKTGILYRLARMKKLAKKMIEKSKQSSRGNT
ncbi:MAG: Coenzyme F420 hydrogenase/dehydrogenase, beta subunit C-terminal domain [Lachnospiraceae bacterium]